MSEWWEDFETGQVLEKADLDEWLPHRGDMSLLSRVCFRDECAYAEIDLSDKAFWVPGHFPVPEQQLNPNFQIGPLYPGVLMVESAAQLGICLWRQAMGFEETKPKIMVFKEITKASFKRDARPGELFRIRCEMEKCSLRLMRCNYEGRIFKDDGVHVAFTCSIAGMSV